MKTTLFTIITFSIALSANAQKPFKEIGKDNEVEVLTLSNGRYIEHFTYDTLRQIGSVMFNTVTHKVEYFIAQDDSIKQKTVSRVKEASRFMSVDPLTRNFPNLSPYQYASNRPIDGIDMDGLEYITVNVLLKDGGATVMNTIDHTKTMTDAQIQAVHGMSAEKFYKEHSKAFEKRGQGILYNYYTQDNKGALSKVGDYMENKESLFTYGIYAGKGCLTYCGGNDEKNPFVKREDVSDYNFTQTPLDEFDAIAQKHDITQSKIPNSKGHWNEPRTLESDNVFVQETEAYIKRASAKDYKDEYTGRAPSAEAIKNAKQALFYFKNIEVPRKERLNKKENKSKE